MALNNFTRADGRNVHTATDLDFLQYEDYEGKDLKLIEAGLLVGCKVRLNWQELNRDRTRAGIYLVGEHTGEFVEMKIKKLKWDRERKLDATLPLFEIKVGKADGIMQGVGEAAIGKICAYDPILIENEDAIRAVTELELNTRVDDHTAARVERAHFHWPVPGSIYYVPPLQSLGAAAVAPN